ncbi:ABC transporter permease [Microbacterium sp. NPDC057659]|jgi:peptide/nickel transport system permease protein|uniref:ABC transporter permease n=1 Tax=unclassified Microbacterium TaxID=2609290 RepID=UPI00283E37C5|nr:ABC transporter permease [Microbacterium sp.]
MRLAFLARRIGLYLIAAFAAVTINFLIPRLAPGDPATAALARLGSVDPSAIESLRTAYGITDDPLIVQYFQYLGDLLHGDFGLSFSRFPSPVTEVISGTLGWSLLLGGTALVLSYVIGSVLGIVAAWFRGSWFDRIVPATLLFIGSFPYFFLALLLVYWLGVQLGVLPIGQAYEYSDPAPTPEFFGDVAVHLFLPVLTIVIVSLGTWTLNMRNAMIGELGQDYLTLAEAKGLSQPRIALRHAARNALLPSVTLLGGMIGVVVGGQIMTEIVFSYPGVGYTLMQAVTAHDYPLIQALFLIITLTVLAANLLVDLVYSVLDPRVLQRSGS